MKSVKLPALDAESNIKKTTITIKRGKRETVDDDSWSPMRPVEIKIDAGFKVCGSRILLCNFFKTNN